MKKITIVTVCFNAQRTIKETIESVVRQTYKNIEYIIIDGCSQDNTMDIIREYSNDDRITVISEPDDGLYNAMNKAVKMATGDYINFMNSGDVFYDNKVIEEIQIFLDKDVVYGDVIRDRSGSKNIERIYSHTVLYLYLSIGRMMSHQSVFTKTNIMKKYMFDENHRICADYDFILRTLHDKCSYRYVPKVISITNCGDGISQQSENLDEMRREDDESLKKYFRFLYYLTRIPRIIVRKFAKMN